MRELWLDSGLNSSMNRYEFEFDFSKTSISITGFGFLKPGIKETGYFGVLDLCDGHESGGEDRRRERRGG